LGLDTALGSLLAAFGLSGAAGLNAWLPLFASALLARLDVVELAAPFDDLTSTPALVILGALMTADFVGDKIPAVDHVLHAAGAVVAPVSGAILFTGQTGLETDLPTLLAAVLGGATAGTIHAGRAAVRPVSTATTGGVGNPLLSISEDAGSLLLVVTAFVLPLIALLLVLLLVVGLLSAWRRVRRVPSRR
jgi:Domain of unknown function (DUF4126)